MDDVKKVVQDWYARHEHWGAQGKDAGWADHILVDHGNLLKDRDVLNLGCFFPEDETQFAGVARSWTAIDFVPEVIARAKEMVPGVRFQVADMQELPFLNDSFDVVLDFSSGDHLPEDGMRKTLAEVQRVTRNGGEFVWIFTNRLAMAECFECWKGDATEEWGRFGYSHGYSLDEARQMLAEAGFAITAEANPHLPRSGFRAKKGK